MYKTQTLNGIWEWQETDGPGWYQGTVPGSVLSDMLALGQIEDPYWRCNEYAVRELMAKDYRYRRNFVVAAEDLASDEAELVCEGLDTIAAIYINGQLAANTDDMHRRYRIPVKQLLRTGENEIVVCFDSPLAFVRNEDANNDIFYASTGCIRGNAALRKAHYMFGWDWGPQLPDAGIIRGISIEYSDGVRWQDVYIRQQHEADGSVRLGFDVAIQAPGKASSVVRYHEQNVPGGNYHARLEIRDPDGGIICDRMVPLTAGGFEEVIQNPRIWWPNGLGLHPLYQVKLVLLGPAGETEYDIYECRLGLRTVTVSTDKNKYGNEFAITVNGVRIFTMGANYIPEDNLLTRVSAKRSTRLIEDCAAANFNCLRIWGGGYYPDDSFYDTCDEMGILVWQDLMFGCNIYALTDSFEANIVAETKDIVRRLRNHACLALWCGNNEMEWGWADEWARLKGHHPRYKADYTKIFEYILPRVITSLDDQTFYWPSSPSSGGSFDAPNATDRGDQHYWEVWHSGKPFTDYGDFSFCSEYGFQSFPHSKTIKSFTLPEDRNIFSRVMESHQKNGTANGKILNYVADYFLYPKNLSSLAYISQLLQLKAITYGVERWRRNRGRCMGSLYWQLNDCWLVASWSSIDYYGRWKALHYGAKRFYAPVTISICEKEELSSEVSYYIHNDTLADCCCKVEMLLVDTQFQVLWEASAEYMVKALSVSCCGKQDFSGWTDDETLKTSVFSVFRLYDNARVVAERVILFVKPKHFDYPKTVCDVSVTERGDKFEITVKSECFVQYAELWFDEIDIVFSDNFFDITSPAGVTVSINKAELPDFADEQYLREHLKVRTVADSYETREEW